MGSYISFFAHLVWATKGRMPYFSPAGKKRLHNYITAMIQRKFTRFELLAIGGMEDHVHLLVRLRSVGDISPLVRYVKSVSSKFVNENKRGSLLFAWQKKYSAFSISASHIGRVRRYICNQEEHHRRFNYEEELKFFEEF